MLHIYVCVCVQVHLKKTEYHGKLYIFTEYNSKSKISEDIFCFDLKNLQITVQEKKHYIKTLENFIKSINKKGFIIIRSMFIDAQSI